MLEEDRTMHSKYLAVGWPFTTCHIIQLKNNPLMIWKNQIFWHYTGHNTLALTIIEIQCKKLLTLHRPI